MSALPTDPEQAARQLFEAPIERAEALTGELAPATRRAYDAAWGEWESWCSRANVSSMPAAPEHLAGWLTDVAFDGDEPRLAPGSCAQRLAAIAYRHRVNTDTAGLSLENPAAHPLVRLWLRDYRRRSIAAGRAHPRHAAPLTADAAAAIRETATRSRTGPGGHTEDPDRALDRGLEDRVIVGLLRDGLLRPSEAASVRWRDLKQAEDGSGRLTLRVSDTESDDNAPAIWLSPQTMRDINALREYMRYAWGLGRPEQRVLSVSAAGVARRLAAAGKAAGLETRLTGQSGRVGMARDLIARGASVDEVMKAGRWSTPTEIVRYTQDLTAEENAVARWYAEQGQ